MPLTQFPNGISTRTSASTNSSAGDNDLTCLDLFVDGTVSITGATTITGSAIVTGSASITGGLVVTGVGSFGGILSSASTAGITGQYGALIFTFGTASTAQVTSIPVPFAGNIEACYVTTGSVSAVVAGYTVRVGSAGTVAVATVSNTTASQGVQELLTITTTTFAITNALVCTRSVQGTAGDTAICVVVRKTA